MHIITYMFYIQKYDKLNIIRQYFIKNAYYLHIYNFNYKYNYEYTNEYNITVLWKQYRDVDRLWTLCTLKED